MNFRWGNTRTTLKGGGGSGEPTIREVVQGTRADFRVVWANHRPMHCSEQEDSPASPCKWPSEEESSQNGQGHRHCNPQTTPTLNLPRHSHTPAEISRDADTTVAATEYSSVSESGYLIKHLVKRGCIRVPARAFGDRIGVSRPCGVILIRSSHHERNSTHPRRPTARNCAAAGSSRPVLLSISCLTLNPRTNSLPSTSVKNWRRPAWPRSDSFRVRFIPQLGQHRKRDAGRQHFPCTLRAARRRLSPPGSEENGEPLASLWLMTCAVD